MANVKTLSQQNLLAAAAGNPALLELLESLMNTVNLTQQATNTTGKNVPPQVSADVSYLKGNYIVQITNPGGASPVSTIQQQQATQGATQATTIRPVTPILHQIRCATDPRFSIASKLQTFGGDTGSTQTYWTLTNLGSGNFYFQVRSSYDGVNWNQWRNCNGGQSLTSAPTAVTTEEQTNSTWAVFTLPGNELIAVGEGYAPDGGTFTLPENLYSSAMFALAGPNGFTDIGRHVCDIVNCEVGVSTPSDTSGTVGIPDYPVVVKMKYGDQSSPQVLWSGNANIFAIAFDPAGNNVTRYVSPDGTTLWAVFTLPGGGQFAIGQGRTADGANIWIPDQAPWVTPANVLSICSPQGNVAGFSAQGIQICQLTAVGANLQAQCKYGNGPNTWPGDANWLAVASNLPFQTLSGGKWLVINMAGRNQVAFGAGQSPDNSSLQFPGGMYWDKSLSIVTPAGYTGAGDHLMHGVSQCELNSMVTALAYADGSGNTWGGNCNWFAFAWSNPQPNAGPTPPPGPPATVVYITPANVQLASGGVEQFTATVVNNANPNVTWAVDGIVGGNTTVGTIDGTGLYNAPTVAFGRGQGHTITATSVGDPTAKGVSGVYIS